MPQDYKRSSNRPAKTQPTKAGSSLPIFLIGMVFGALLMNFAPALLKTAPTATTAVQDVAETVKEEATELKFDFYTLLKNTEIIVPGNEPTDNQDIQPQENFFYLLQAGSFKNSNDAEALRVKLLLLNLNATVETVNLGNGEKWHRVLVGPYTDSSSMAIARAKLDENAIDIVLLQRKL
jgi:cell division protein FtsN